MTSTAETTVVYMAGVVQAAFAGFVVHYGVCEALNGNWSQLDLRDIHPLPG
jgi:hypothetical protein